MEQTTTAPILDARILSHIRRTACRLAGTCYLPGMDAEDIAQDLFLDLWRRRQSFDPAKATFPTFADRVIAHRIATLIAPTARLRAERQHIWLDDPISDDDGATLAETLADPNVHAEDDVALTLDMRRFVAGLPPALLRCCEILLAPCRVDAAAEAGLHRSSVYENLSRLRRLAEAGGLRHYVGEPRQIGVAAGKCSA